MPYTKKWVIALTGASGMPYALRLIKNLLNEEIEQHIIISEAAHQVLAAEQGIKISSAKLNSKSLLGVESDKLHFYNPRDIGAAPSSGSFLFEGMVVVPCSMGTLGAIATGTPRNLIHRAADVALKENRRLILVPRETPLSAIHLENMLKLSRMQVQMVAAMPGFYAMPANINDLVDMLVMKIMDSMGIHRELVPRWGVESPGSAITETKVFELNRG